jgi:hypothetical protein
VQPGEGALYRKQQALMGNHQCLCYVDLRGKRRRLLIFLTHRGIRMLRESGMPIRSVNRLAEIPVGIVRTR